MERIRFIDECDSIVDHQSDQTNVRHQKAEVDQVKRSPHAFCLWCRSDVNLRLNFESVSSTVIREINTAVACTHLFDKVKVQENFGKSVDKNAIVKTERAGDDVAVVSAGGHTSDNAERPCGAV